MRQKMMGRLIAFALVFAMLLSFDGMSNIAVASAKAKAPKLSKKSVTVKVGNSKKVTIKNKPAKAKVTWKSKNKKIATVKKGKIKGVKAGNTKITVKVTYKKAKKKVTKKFTIKVKVTAKSSGKANTKVTPTKQPSAAVPSKAPNNSNGNTVTPAATATPLVTRTPVPARTPEADAKEANVVEDGSVSDSNLTDEHTSRYGLKTKDNGMMRTNLSAQDLTPVMGMGWNIGNSLEQTGASSCTALTPEVQDKLTDAEWVKGYETNAGNPVSSQKLFSGLKRYGINTIRIPIAWSNMMTQEIQEDGSTYYRINEAYFDRVEEVINYCLNEEMYVIINDHWDNQWWGMFGDKDQAVRDQAWKKYEDMWTQIANRYVDYSDRLIFEGGNEELGERLNDNWQGEGGSKGVLTQEETYELTNQINQKFVDIIRGTGVNADGKKNNNYYRMLLIPGYDTNLHQTCGDKYSNKAGDQYTKTPKEPNDKLTYTMPTDVEENGISKLFVSIHYYDPLGWGIAKTAATYETPKGTSSFVDTWGSDDDYAAMLEDFEAVREAFTDKGYGVIFGEFGCVSVNKDGIPAYFKEFFSKCQEYGAVPVMWDEGGYVDRKGTGNGGYAYFVYEDIGAVFCEITGSEVELKDEAKKKLTMTGKPENIVAENQNPLVVATWEGDFMRNTNGSDSVNYEEMKKVFGEDCLMTMSGNTTAAWFRTNAITVNSNYPDLTLTATSDQYRWHSHFLLSDWSQIKEPGIRITMHDDMISKSAQLQLAFTNGLWEDGDDYEWKYESDYEQVQFVAGDEYTDAQVAALPSTVNYINADGEKFSDSLPALDENNNMILADTAWQEKVLKLNPKYLEHDPVVLLTTNTYLGVDFQKVEIVDLAYNADGTQYVSASEDAN